MRFIGIRIICRLIIAILFFSSALFQPPSSAQNSSPQLDVRVIADEADAVLAILAKKKAGRAIEGSDWQRVFASEGYIRLKKREASLKRDFTDADFKAFVLSDDLSARAQAIEETLNQWKKADVTASARLALAYLPKGARMRAKIYPSIRQVRSRVFLAISIAFERPKKSSLPESGDCPSRRRSR